MKISNKVLKVILGIESIAIVLVILLWISLDLPIIQSIILSATTSSPATLVSVSITQTIFPTHFIIPTPLLADIIPSQNSTLLSTHSIVSLTPSPVFIKQIVIGQSVSGSPLTVYRLGNGQIKRLILAGIHGGYEWNTVHLAEKLVEYIKTNPATIPPDITLYVLPVFNPDGYNKEFGPMGRANTNGVDINRNFDAFWEADWPRKGCWNQEPITAGSAPDSEPETRALESFLLEYEIDALISYHSAALGIFPGGRPPDEDSRHLAETIHSVSAYPYPPLDYGCIYTGQLIDWAVTHDIAAIDIELSTHTELDYEINLKVLERFLIWRK